MEFIQYGFIGMDHALRKEDARRIVVGNESCSFVFHCGTHIRRYDQSDSSREMDSRLAPGTLIYESLLDVCEGSAR